MERQPVPFARRPSRTAPAPPLRYPTTRAARPISPYSATNHELTLVQGAVRVPPAVWRDCSAVYARRSSGRPSARATTRTLLGAPHGAARESIRRASLYAARRAIRPDTNTRSGVSPGGTNGRSIAPASTCWIAPQDHLSLLRLNFYLFLPRLNFSITCFSCARLIQPGYRNVTRERRHGMTDSRETILVPGLNEDGEVRLDLANGCSLRSGGVDFTSGEYVRLCDPEGYAWAVRFHPHLVREMR